MPATVCQGGASAPVVLLKKPAGEGTNGAPQAPHHTEFVVFEPATASTTTTTTSEGAEPTLVTLVSYHPAQFNLHSYDKGVERNVFFATTQRHGRCRVTSTTFGLRSDYWCVSRDAASVLGPTAVSVKTWDQADELDAPSDRSDRSGPDAASNVAPARRIVLKVQHPRFTAALKMSTSDRTLTPAQRAGLVDQAMAQAWYGFDASSGGVEVDGVAHQIQWTFAPAGHQDAGADADADVRPLGQQRSLFQETDDALLDWRSPLRQQVAALVWELLVHHLSPSSASYWLANGTDDAIRSATGGASPRSLFWCVMWRRAACITRRGS